MQLHTRFDLNWILILLLAVFAVAPLTYPGFFEASSGFLPAFNAAHLSEAPNWAGIAGMVRGEGFLPYVLVWPLYRLTGSGVVAVKWGYGLAFVLGALGIYAWTRRWLGARGGVLSATIYTYLPWHLSTVYVRGAYAEAWLWALWPWILWAIDHSAERTLRSMVGGGIASLALAAATLWVQPGLATLALPLLIGYGIIVSIRRSWHWLALVETAGLLALFFLFAIGTKVETQVPFGEHFLHPFQLLSAAWESGQSYQLGVAAVGLSIVAVALYVGKRDMRQGGSETSSSPATIRPLAFWFWVSSLLVLVLLCLPILAWLWQFTGLDDLLTYPWQLLSLSALPLAFLAGSVIRLDRRLSDLPAWAGVVALVVLASYPYLAPRYTQMDPGPEPVALFQPVEAGTPQILLLDAKVGQPLELEDTQALTLTLTWQAVEPVAQDYTAFVHVLAADGTKVAQRDTWPCDGECPISSWQPGEVIVDNYELNWGQDAEVSGAQPTQLVLGLYLVESGDRALVVGREDRTVFLNVP
jgi:hypothetical protein